MSGAQLLLDLLPGLCAGHGRVLHLRGSEQISAGSTFSRSDHFEPTGGTSSTGSRRVAPEKTLLQRSCLGSDAHRAAERERAETLERDGRELAPFLVKDKSDSF
jgi:hypothetical protein